VVARIFFCWFARTLSGPRLHRRIPGQARPLRGARRGSVVKHTKEQSSFRSDCIGREKSLKSWVSGAVSKSENRLEALQRGNADLEESRDSVFTIRYILIAKYENAISISIDSFSGSCTLDRPDRI